MKLTKSLLTAILMTTVVACSSTSPEEKLAKQQKRNEVLNQRVSESEQLMNALTSRVEQAKSDNLNYFAPDQLKDALDAYKDAKEDFDEIAADKTEATKSQVADIKEYVFAANTALDAAYTVKKNAETILADAFDVQSQLKSLNAPSIKRFSRSYKNLSDDINDIVEEIADGDLEDARTENGKLMPKLRALEVDVVQYIELTPVKNKLLSLKKSRADKYVPNAYQQASSSIRIADSTVASNPRDKEQIASAVANAQFALARTTQLLQAVQRLAKVRTKDRESYVTEFETLLLNISQAVADKDLRNMSINNQAKEIISLVNTTKSKLDSVNTSIANSNQESQAQIDELNSELASVSALLESTQETLNASQQQNSELEELVQTLEIKALESEKRILELEAAALRTELELNQQETTTESQPASNEETAEQAAENKEEESSEAEQSSPEPSDEGAESNEDDDESSDEPR